MDWPVGLFWGFVRLVWPRRTGHDIEVRTQEARVRLSMKDVDELVTSRQSMMPEGMLRQYTDQQVRDLLRYLASPGQVPLPAGGSE